LFNNVEQGKAKVKFFLKKLSMQNREVICKVRNDLIYNVFSKKYLQLSLTSDIIKGMKMINDYKSENKNRRNS